MSGPTTVTLTLRLFLPLFRQCVSMSPAMANISNHQLDARAPANLGALKPWKPATLDSWSLATSEPWNPATFESCNPGALELWNFRLFASLEPALGTLKFCLKLWILGLSRYGSLGPWNLGTRKLGVLEVWGSRVMESWNPKLDQP